jgi:hypothetical protein
MGGRKTPQKQPSPAEARGGGALAAVSGLKKGWDAAFDLFRFSKSQDALRAGAGLPDINAAFLIFLAGGFIVFAIAALTAAINFQYANFTLETYGEVTGVAQQTLDLGLLVPSAAYQFLLYVVFGFILNIVHQSAAFYMARLTGGKGTYRQHMGATSVVWFAVALSLSAALMAPLTCIGAFLALVSIWAVTLVYLMIYTNARAISLVHDISLLHSLAITILLVLPYVALWLFATDQLAVLLGLPTTINISPGV